MNQDSDTSESDHHIQKIAGTKLHDAEKLTASRINKRRPTEKRGEIIIMKIILQSIIVIFSAIIIILPVHADGIHPSGIKLDGSVGNAGQLALPGPDYNIRAEHGQQAGSNLFHSFRQFNIHSGESATFTGPNSVQNIVSRVTGGAASWIDGRLGSAIPNADLWFLNPAGVMFGPNASLDLSGSFHVSTADYLRMGENDRFYTTPHADDMISVAAPAAFGFLDSDAAPVTIQGRGEISEQEWNDTPTGIRVSDGKTISLVAGSIEMRNGTNYETGSADENGEPVTKMARPGEVVAPGGNVRIISVASKGETAVQTGPGLEVTSAERGDISISDKSLIDVSGTRGGNVLIRGGRFVVSDGAIHAKTTGSQDGLGVSIQTDEVSFADTSEISTDTKGSGKGGDVVIQADNVSFTDGSEISASTYGEGRGGSVTINASESVSFAGENSQNSSRIFVRTFGKDEGAGDTGDILIQAKNVSFTESAWATTSTVGKGNGGDIAIQAGDSLRLGGGPELSNFPSMIIASVKEESNGGHGGNILIEAGDILMSDGASVNTAAFGPGNGGDMVIRASGKVEIKGALSSEGYASMLISSSDSKTEGVKSGEGGSILLEAEELVLKDGGQISSSSIAPRGTESSDAGKIVIRVTGAVRLSGVNPYGENEDGFGSGIYARSKGVGDNAGDAGKIDLEAGSLTFEDGAVIESGTSCNAKGGDVEIRVRDSVNVSGDSSGVQLEEARDSQNAFQEGFAPYEPGDPVSGISSASESESPDAGSPGNVLIRAETISFTDRAMVSNETKGGSDGGDVILEAEAISFTHGAGISADTHSQGHAGGIIIKASEIYLSNGAFISSETLSHGKGGDAGAIIICKEIELGDGSIAITQPSETIRMEENARINTSSRGEGHAGLILMGTARLELGQESLVESASLSPDKGGDAGGIIIAKYIRMTSDKEAHPVIQPCDTLRMEKSYINTSSMGEGDAGMISVKTNHLELGNGSRIVSASGSPGKGGMGGVILIHAGHVRMREDARIVSSTRGEGNAGGVALEADHLDMSSGASIVSESISSDLGGDAGAIIVAKELRLSNDSETFDTDEFIRNSTVARKIAKVDDFSIIRPAQDITMTDEGTAISTSGAGQGNAGMIALNADRIHLDDHASVSSASTSENDGGTAGLIWIVAGDSVRLSGKSSLNTQAESAGGGNIVVNAGDKIYLLNGEITSSVRQGKGSGGDVTTDSAYVILNHGTITANAEEGDGGAIFIHTDNYIRSSESKVTATSKRGNDGTVKIESPEVDISGGLVSLPASFLNVERLAKNACPTGAGKKKSRLLIKSGRDGVPMSHDDFLPCGPAWLDKSDSDDNPDRKGYLDPSVLPEDLEKP